MQRDKGRSHCLSGVHSMCLNFFSIWVACRANSSQSCWFSISYIPLVLSLGYSQGDLLFLFLFFLPVLVSIQWVQGEQMPEVSGTETGCLKAGLGPRWNASLLAAGVLERALWYRIAYFFNQLGSSLPQLTSFTGQWAGPCPILSCRVSEHPYWCGRRRKKTCAEEQCSPCLWWHWLEHAHVPGRASPAERAQNLPLSEIAPSLLTMHAGNDACWLCGATPVGIPQHPLVPQSLTHILWWAPLNPMPAWPGCFGVCGVWQLPWSLTPSSEQEYALLDQQRVSSMFCFLCERQSVRNMVRVSIFLGAFPEQCSLWLLAQRSCAAHVSCSAVGSGVRPRKILLWKGLVRNWGEAVIIDNK